MTGQHEVRAVQPVFDEQFHFFERQPVALRLGAFPHAQLSRLKYMLGIYAQDTWTLDRLTLNMGVRFDALNNADFVPDCDLRSSEANGECGPFENRLFGTPLPTQQFSPDVTEGWHVRPHNWTMSAVLQHELLANVGLEVGYFRTIYGNQRVTDNLAVTPGDFDPFCVTAPTDPRLPGGGGYEVCDLYDVRPDRFGQIDNVDVHADDFGGHSDVYNGMDIKLNARLPQGTLLFGGVSLGTRTENVCNNPDVPPQFCETTRGWTEQGQIKLGGSYPLPFNLTASATWQNLPGLPRTATLSYGNDEIRQSLGRDLSACRGITPCNARRTVQILEPQTDFEPRYNVIDVRLSYSATVNNVRIRPQVDIYNLTNSGAAAFVFGNWGAAWPFPFEVSTARLVKFGMQVDF